MFYLNYYLKPNDETVYKFVKNSMAYANWTLIETYFFENGKIVTYPTYKKMISSVSPIRCCLNRLLELFNKW